MDHTQVSGRAVAKVVLDRRRRARRPLLLLPDQGGRRPLPDRGVLRHRDHPGGQLARGSAGCPGGSRSCSSTCRSRASIFGIGLLIVPPLVNGVTDLSNDLPGYVDDLRHNETFRDYDNRYHITEKLTEQADQLPSKLGDAAGTLRDVTVGVFNRFVQLFSILVITFFLVKDGHRLLNFLYRQMPPERARRLRRIAWRHLGRDRRLRVRQLRDQRPGRAGDLRHPADPRGAVRPPAGDPVRVLRPDPARRRDPGRDPGRDRGRLRQLPGRADRLGGGADPLPADREQPDPAVGLRAGRSSCIP